MFGSEKWQLVRYIGGALRMWYEGTTVVPLSVSFLNEHRVRPQIMGCRSVPRGVDNVTMSVLRGNTGLRAYGPCWQSYDRMRNISIA